MLPLDAYRESVLALTGQDLAWLEWGAERPGRPVVCLHGHLAVSHVWDQFASHLGEGRRVIAPDLRGHGNSAPVDPPAYLDRDYRHDMEALLAHLRCPSVDFVGHGIGGVVALMIAGARPELVSRVVLVDVPPRPAARQQQRLRALDRRMSGVFSDYSALDAATRDLLPAATDDARQWLLPYLFRRVEGGHVAAWDAAAVRQGDGWNGEPWLARVRCPVLALHSGPNGSDGDDDPFNWAAHLDDVRMLPLPPGGHLPMVDQAAAFTRAALDLLQAPDRAAFSPSDN